MMRNNGRLTSVAAMVAALLVTGTGDTAVQGQSLSGRIADYRQRQARVQQQEEGGDSATPDFVPVPRRLASIALDPVELEDEPLRQVVKWFAQATGIPVVAHWEKLEAEGVDPDTPITLQLRSVPAEHLLELLAQHASTELTPLLFEATPWYVELLTRRQANARVVVRMYPVNDLLMEVPNFDNAPSFDLNDALSSSGSRGAGSSGGGSSTSLFGDQEDDDEEDAPTKQERGETLAQLVRDTVEPEIWIENGGEYSSIRYLQGMLIVRAPRYVHRLIGGAGSGAIAPRGEAVNTAAPAPRPGLSGVDASGKATDVSSVRQSESAPVSGTQP